MTPEELETAHLEITYLRKEIETRTGDQSTLERNVVVGIGAIYTALATVPIINTQIAAASQYLWLVPILLAVGGTARFFDHHSAIARIADYIRELESQLKPLGGGWEHFYAARPRDAAAFTIRWLSWYILIGITASIAYFAIRY
jgi:hypothetical protein